MRPASPAWRSKAATMGGNIALAQTPVAGFCYLLCCPKQSTGNGPLPEGFKSERRATSSSSHFRENPGMVHCCNRRRAGDRRAVLGFTGARDAAFDAVG